MFLLGSRQGDWVDRSVVVSPISLIPLMISFSDIGSSIWSADRFPRQLEGAQIGEDGTRIVCIAATPQLFLQEHWKRRRPAADDRQMDPILLQEGQTRVLLAVRKSISTANRRPFSSDRGRSLWVGEGVDNVVGEAK